MIQIATLTLTIIQTEDASSLLITIFSMIFTIISILISVFEYFLSSKFLILESSIIITFNIESIDVSSMRYAQFLQEIVFKRNRFVDSIAKILQLERKQIERLKPKQDTKGAIFTLAIATDVFYYEYIQNTITQAVVNGDLAQVCFIFIIVN